MSPLKEIEATSQPKHQTDVLALLDEMQHSPFIGEISPDEIARLLHASSVLFFYDGDTLAGLAAWDVIDGTWVEVGPFYTAKAYRGQGVGSLMFDTVERTLSRGGHKLYGVTKNPVVKQMFVKRGFHQVAIWTLPREVWLYLLRKLTFRRLLRHGRKLRFGDSVSHFIKSEHQSGR
jgi:GNAT superfamily N-acetyltransferase